MLVLIPVMSQTIAASAIGVLDILNFTKAFCNQIDPQDAGSEIFNARLVAIEGNLSVAMNGLELFCHYTLDTAPKADMIIVPASVTDHAEFIAKNPNYIDWLMRQYQGGAILCSTCTGSFYIAATGLLDNQEATTSWFMAKQFREMFPMVLLKDERLIIDIGQIITGGATMSYTNLCIYLIERHFGKRLASYVAKMFLVEKGNDTQKPFQVFFTQKVHNDPEILKAQEFIEEHFQRKLSIKEVSESIAMGERSFIRRFKTATGNTPQEYIQRVKIEYAKELLEDHNFSIKEIPDKIGYEDLGFFRDVFKRYAGLTPNEYRNKFRFQIGPSVS